jgi:hypothetical protein
MRYRGTRFQIDSEKLFAEAGRIFSIFPTSLIGARSHHSGKENAGDQEKEST